MINIYRFEYDCEPLIGHQHCEELLNLHIRLLDYVGSNPYEISFYERYTLGTEIYDLMMMIFSSYETPPPNLDLWEQRWPTEAELSEMFGDFDEYADLPPSRFWDIKRNFPKSKRSVLQEKEFCSMEEISEMRWSEFIVYLMSMFLKANFDDKPLSWSNDFSRLYREYQYKSSPNTVDKAFSNKKFDTFLYLRLSHLAV